MGYYVFQYNNKAFMINRETGDPFTISSNPKADLCIPELGKTKFLFKPAYQTAPTVTCKELGLHDLPLSKNKNTILNLPQRIAVYYKEHLTTNQKTVKLPYNGLLTIGRAEDNDIVLDDPYVSSHHLTIQCENGEIHVQDKNSSNGLFLNGYRISSALVHSGDILSILHVGIRPVGNELFFDNVDHLTVHLRQESVRFNGQANTYESGNGKVIYRRSPRTRERLPEKPITLAPPPTPAGKLETGKKNLSRLAGPGAMIAASMIRGISSPAMMAASAAGLISPAINILSGNGSKERRKQLEEYERNRAEKYGFYISEQKSKIELVAQEQRGIITRENPPALSCAENLAHVDRTLWERGITDSDFMKVRLGMGYDELCVPVKHHEEYGIRMETDEQLRLVDEIIEESRIVDNIPARLDLFRHQTVGFIGNRSRVIGLVRNMLMEISYLHAYTDLTIIGIFDAEEKARWDAVRWLPHIWDESEQTRFLAYDKEDAEYISETYAEILKTRIRAARENREGARIAPFYLFLMGSKELTEKTELLQMLLLNEPGISASALLLYDDIYSLPHACQFIIDVDNGPCGYEKSAVNQKFFFTVDQIASREQFDSFCRRMSAIELESGGKKSAIPHGITFLKGYGVRRPEELDAWERWQTAKPYRSLGAPIGIMAGDEPFIFDIHEKAHGPHGLIAGTTGSGKSETIISWILSMCINYHPYDVSFVIIDYKGGSMADNLTDLPHVIGKITNIDSGIQRILDSLNAELRRRQVLLAACKEEIGVEVKDILQYQEYYHKGLLEKPIPHLIIVADEFAELKTNQPEFMKDLVQTARIGRSLGVHLVLATQKPTGIVDDQISSNSKFRICLKVATSADSREMIRTPDAAHITQSGRAFILVGESDLYEQFQSFYSGGEYDQDTEKKAEGNTVSIVKTNGERLGPAVIHAEKDGSVIKTTELMAVREYLCGIAASHHIEKLQGPWLEELPDQLTLDELDPGTGAVPWLQIPIGIYDDPEHQTQGIQYVDFCQDGHLGIYGAPMTGKTSLLKTILVSAARHFTPDDIVFYVLDFGGWSMSSVAGFPHVGGVALDCEEEKVQKLGEMLQQEMISRKRMFLADGVSSLAGYREIHGTGLPAMVIVIDNIVPVFEAYPDLEPLLITLVGQGASYGMYLMYTSGSTTGIRYKILQNIKNAVSFEMTDKGDYLGIIGRADHNAVVKKTGRAFAKGTPPVLFQAALYAEGASEKERVANMKKEAAVLSAAWTGTRPARIPVMPETVSFRELFDAYTEQGLFPVGVSYADIQTVKADLRDHYNLLITGTIKSGKSRMLSGIAEQIRLHCPKDRIYVLDSVSRSLQELETAADRYAQVDKEQEVTALLKEIEQLLNTRAREYKQGIEADHDICIFVDNLKEFVEIVNDDNKRLMERISKLAHNLKVRIFYAGRVTDMEKLNQIESLTRGIISNQTAIALGAKPAVFSFLHNHLNYKEKDMEPGEGNGFYYQNGTCIRMKLPQ